jgi:hypothetical protein
MQLPIECSFYPFGCQLILPRKAKPMWQYGLSHNPFFRVFKKRLNDVCYVAASFDAQFVQFSSSTTLYFVNHLLSSQVFFEFSSTTD